jgi:glycosyltransferase involved in cell wall biosynthesis
MNVLMISRDSLFTDAGGDTVQLTSTAKYLRELGVNVDIKLSKDVTDFANYDLVHFFNIIRPADIIVHADKLKIPYVISTIYVEYNELEKVLRKGLLKILFNLLTPDTIEYMKCVARWLKKGDKIRSKYYLFGGHRRSVIKSLNGAALLLPNSHSEYNRLSNFYKVKRPYTVIPNAIDTEIFNTLTVHADKKYENTVVCIGRIEVRKNQLKLIESMKSLPYRLVLIGKGAPNQPDYYNECRNTAGSNVEFIDFLEQHKIASILKAAKVHVLPSWFETTGLVSLEAAVMGCNIVVTHKGDQSEYFEKYAYFCDPADTGSIRNAVRQAFEGPKSNEFRDKILNEYTWKIAAEKTLEAYKTILK